jgi:hypothetical protein
MTGVHGNHCQCLQRKDGDRSSKPQRHSKTETTHTSSLRALARLVLTSCTSQQRLLHQVGPCPTDPTARTRVPNMSRNRRPRTAAVLAPPRLWLTCARAPCSSRTLLTCARAPRSSRMLALTAWCVGSCAAARCVTGAYGGACTGSHVRSHRHRRCRSQGGGGGAGGQHDAHDAVSQQCASRRSHGLFHRCARTHARTRSRMAWCVVSCATAPCVTGACGGACTGSHVRRERHRRCRSQGGGPQVFRVRFDR